LDFNSQPREGGWGEVNQLWEQISTHSGGEGGWSMAV
jgi:hypothetical protein